MHHVSKVAVEGFWDTHDFELELFQEVTFLIGPNGTGKTTLINLIAAALTADLRTLDRTPFRRVTIYMTSIEKEADARIVVTKSARSERSERIQYRIFTGQKTGEEIKFSITGLDDRIVTRRNMADGRLYREYTRAVPAELTDALQALAAVNWLSVNRTPLLEAGREERSNESGADQRLTAISNEIVRYFSTLSRRKDDQVRSFQESIFLSLLDHKDDSKYIDSSFLQRIPEFLVVLENIFDELHVSKELASDVLERFRQTTMAIMSRVVQHVNTKETNIATGDAVFILGLHRISALIERWNELQAQQTAIFAPRDKWLSIANGLFQRKKMEVTASNELQFISRSGKILTPQMLSSGEKQLLILLSETLLQRGRPVIFIADEPELSLHVLWQEKLVSSLRALNPFAQIIAATHSPDIVGALSDRAIDMEMIIP